MRLRAILPILLLIAALGAFALTGCQQQADEATPTEAEEAVPPEEMEAPEDGEEPPLPAGHEEAAEPGPPPTELEDGGAKTMEGLTIDPNRAYGPEELERLRAVLTSGDEQFKVKARSLLEQLLLESNVPMTRSTAARVLTSSPDESVEALKQAALNDPEAEVRQAAIQALGQAKMSPELIDAMAQLQQADDASIRSQAIVSEIDLRLSDPASVADPTWMARLLARRRDDATAQLQMKLVLAGPKVLPALKKVLADAESPVARQAAACAIALICAGTSPKQQEFAELAQTIKKETLPESHPANLEGLKPLEKALATDPSPIVRAIAAQGLGYLGQESSAPLLGEALHDENEEVRWWAALALVTVPAEAALEDLSEAATEDPSVRVREAAVRALGWVENDRAVLPLIRATADQWAGVRQAAATELGRFRTGAALQALINLFEDPDEDVRWAAVMAVGKLGASDAQEALLRAMHDPSPMVANAAERALQRMGVGARRFGTRDEI